MNVFEPDRDAIIQRFSAGEQVLVSTPFYSRKSLEWIAPSVDGRLEFWTRLNPFDWVTGVSDPEALLNFLQDFGDNRVVLRVHRALHAKIYLVDNAWACFGSANLSINAFYRNLEIMCTVSGEEVTPVVDFVNALRPRLTEVPLKTFETYILTIKDVVETQKEKESTTTEDMQVAVDLADDLVSTGAAGAPVTKFPELEEFTEFLRQQPETAARVVVARHEGLQNLQGHVKQSYYGAILYLMDPSHEEQLRAIQQMTFDDLPQHDEETIRSWQTFLDQHATAKDDERGMRLSVLRRQLPERWGGYTTTGGGASSTFTRTLALAARFVGEFGLA